MFKLYCSYSSIFDNAAQLFWYFVLLFVGMGVL